MRNTLVIIAILIANNAIGQNKKTSWVYDELKGQVKTLITKSYDTKTLNGTSTKKQMIDDEYGFTVIKYSPSGEWTNYLSYNIDGGKRWSENPVYDTNDHIIERRDFIHTKSDSTLNGKYSYQNDGFGNITESVKKSSSDSLIWKRKYRYDTNGNNIESFRFNSKNAIESKSVNKYDLKHNLIEEDTFDAKDSLIEKTGFKYDAHNQLIEECVFKKQLIDRKTKYQYNKKGFKSIIYTYKADGSLGKKREYKYKFDLQGNWIERIEYINNKAEMIKEREIEYFSKSMN